MATYETYELGPLWSPAWGRVDSSRSPTRFAVARPEDLLYVEVEILPNENALALYFPSQHVMEYQIGSYPPPEPFLPVPAIPSGTVLMNTPFLQYSASPEEARGLVGRVLENLDGQLCIESGIEFPTLMYLQPFGQSRWSLAPNPRTGGDWTAVWQAELLETTWDVPGVPGPLMQVRSTQDKGFEPTSFGVSPFTSFPEFRGAIFQTRLAMSMLGASGRIRGPHWPPGWPAAPPSVKSYDHAAQLGRDQQMTEVELGHLSSGHPATLETHTTRVFSQMKFTSLPFGSSIDAGIGGSDADPYAIGQTYFAAHLHQTATLTVLEPEVSFEGMDTPFRRLRLTGEVSQVDPNAAPAFWVTRGAVDVHFGLVATDREGREAPFSAPLMFLSLA